MTMAQGTRLGPYDISAQLGEGGMGSASTTGGDLTLVTPWRRQPVGS